MNARTVTPQPRNSSAPGRVRSTHILRAATASLVVGALVASTALFTTPVQAIVRPDRDVYEGEATWTASLVAMIDLDDAGTRTPLHVCSAVLIRPRVLLTAAHCVADGEFSEDWVVHVGHRNRDGLDGVTRRPVSVVYHGLYDRGWHYYDEEQMWQPLSGVARDGEYHFEGDIAVVLLDRSVVGVDPASLPKSVRHRPAPDWRVYGWGTTGEDEYTESDMLLTAAQDDHTVDYRLQTGAPLERVYAAVRYASSGTSATCWGDSGGPLVDGRGVLIGLTSWADAESCSEAVPTLFTRVASYLPWIDQAIQKARKNAPTNRPGSKKFRVSIRPLG